MRGFRRKPTYFIISALFMLFIASLFAGVDLDYKWLLHNPQTRFILILGFISISFSIVILIDQSKSKNRIHRTKLEFETVIANIPGGVVQFTYDDNLSITFLNDGLLKLTGFTELEIEMLLDNSFLNFVHDDNREALASAIVDQMMTNTTVELDCRLKCKNGEYRWFLFKGRMVIDNSQNAYCICVLTDINEAKKAQQDLFLNMQRYRIVTEQSDSIVFEYSFIDQKLYLSEKWNKKFELQYTGDDFLVTALKNNLMHKDDTPRFNEIMNSIIKGETSAEFEVRLKKSKDNYIWCKIKASAVFDENNIAYKTVGKITDIDQQKRETENLKKKAQNDSLTGLFNKGTSEMLINDFLRNEGNDKKHALLIIDIDNFKTVNDTYGHLTGDNVILDIAKTLKSAVRGSDICGRIGGDEFIVLIKNINYIDTVRQKAQEICEDFRHEINPDGNPLIVSASIGVSFFSRDGESFSELVDKADTALYEAKKRGKNQYWIYGSCKEI